MYYLIRVVERRSVRGRLGLAGPAINDVYILSSGDAQLEDELIRFEFKCVCSYPCYRSCAQGRPALPGSVQTSTQDRRIQCALDSAQAFRRFTVHGWCEKRDILASFRVQSRHAHSPAHLSKYKYGPVTAGHVGQRGTAWVISDDANQ